MMKSELIRVRRCDILNGKNFQFLRMKTMIIIYNTYINYFSID